MQCALKIYFVSCCLLSFLCIIYNTLLTGSHCVLSVYHVIPIVTTTYYHSGFAMFFVCVSQKFTLSFRIVYLLLWLIEVWLCPEACLHLDVCNMY